MFFLVVSVGSTLFSLNNLKIQQIPDISGYATGNVNISVLGFTSVTVVSNVEFGQGAIGVSGNETILTTETFHSGTLAYQDTAFNNCSNNVNWSNQTYDCRGIEVKNDGNVYVNVSMYASQNANAFWEGDNNTDEFDYAVLDGNRSHNMSGSCFNNTNLNGTIYENVSTYPINSVWTNYTLFSYNWSTLPTTATLICTNLSPTTGSNAITVEFNITIPSDEPVGTKQNTFTFTAEQVGS